MKASPQVRQVLTDLLILFVLILKVYLSKNNLESGSPRPEVVRRAPRFVPLRTLPGVGRGGDRKTIDQG